MKRKVLLALVALMLGGLMHAHAQLHIGARGGIGMSHYTIREPDDKMHKGDPIFSFNAGVFSYVEIPLAVGHIEVDAAAMLSRLGGKSSWTYPGKITHTQTLTPYYITFPLTTLYAFDIGPAGIYLGVGPQFNIGLFGKQKFETSSPVGSKESTEDIEFGKDENLKRFFMDLKMKAGVELFRRFRLGIYFDLGITNMTDENSKVQLKAYDDRYMRNYAYGLELGIRIL